MSEQKKSKALFLLGLCRKAGKSASGEFSCEDAIRKGTAHLVLLSEDASHNTHKKFHNKRTFYSVPIIDTPFSKEALGAAMGQTARSCVAVCEPGLAKGIMEVLQTGSEAKAPCCEGIDEVD